MSESGLCSSLASRQLGTSRGRNSSRPSVVDDRVLLIQLQRIGGTHTERERGRGNERESVGRKNGDSTTTPFATPLQTCP